MRKVRTIPTIRLETRRREIQATIKTSMKILALMIREAGGFDITPPRVCYPGTLKHSFTET